jgi:undecaprenyl phosphate-alpha-L-ara4N flippase subunit ArnF
MSKQQMTPTSYLLLFLTAICVAAANLLMKAGLLRMGPSFAWSLVQAKALSQQPMFLAGILITGLAALIWLRILSRQSLATIYPVFVSLTYILMVVGEMYFFQEKVSLQKFAGFGIIIAGIAVVARA